jgi:hypothetical protein
MGLKQGAIGNTHGEYIGNMMGTHLELEENMLRTKDAYGKKPSHMHLWF